MGKERKRRRKRRKERGISRKGEEEKKMGEGSGWGRRIK